MTELASKVFDEQQRRAVTDTGREAIDSMIAAFEPKRSSHAQECDAPKINNYGFPTFDRREPDPPAETGWSCGGGDSSSSDSGLSYGGSD